MAVRSSGEAKWKPGGHPQLAGLRRTESLSAVEEGFPQALPWPTHGGPAPPPTKMSGKLSIYGRSMLTVARRIYPKGTNKNELGTETSRMRGTEEEWPTILWHGTKKHHGRVRQVAVDHPIKRPLSGLSDPFRPEPLGGKVGGATKADVVGRRGPSSTAHPLGPSAGRNPPPHHHRSRRRPLHTRAPGVGRGQQAAGAASACPPPGRQQWFWQHPMACSHPLSLDMFSHQLTLFPSFQEKKNRNKI